MTLDTLLAPHKGQSFMRRIMGRSALYVTGDPGKFQDVLSWNDLNHLLEFGGMAYPRLRLIKGGQELPPGAYLRTGSAGYPRLLVREFTAALREGAILAVESIEELHEPISRLCQILEHTLEVQVRADLYASWRDEPKAALRWNDHETMVVQIQGAKTWRLHSPTVARATVNHPPPEPAGQPAWTGVLHAGNLLYIPRGWWYQDEPDEESALYVAVKFRNPTALDVAQRLIGRLKERNELEVPYPRAGGESHNAFLKLIRAELSESLAAPGLLLDFQREERAF